MQRSARLVGSSIATLVNAFNPSVIVIGGVVAGAGQVFLAEVRRRVYELSLPVATQDLTIVRSPDDVREPLRGGMELAREQLFASDVRALVRGRLAERPPLHSRTRARAASY